MNAKLLISTLIIIGLFVTTASSDSYQVNREDSVISAQHSGTRKDALLEYMEALYSPAEGAFYGYLKDWPTDPRIHCYHSLTDLYKPLNTLNRLSSLDYINISNCSVFASSLLNEQEKWNYLGPVNFSRDTSCSCVTCEVSLSVFETLGIISLLPLDEIASFAVLSQGENGGFMNDMWGRLPGENLVDTQTALHTLLVLDKIDLIDQDGVISFLSSCYSEGGFSYVADGYVDFGATPLGLMCLDYLDMLDLIDKNAVMDFVLSFWDNETGCVYDGTIGDTERAIWSLYLLDGLDRIDVDVVVDWVLYCQSVAHGGFLTNPESEPIDERFEWAKAAVHILVLLDRLDALDEAFTVLGTAEHEIPQGYYDFIDEYLETTTESQVPFFPFPNIDIIAAISTVAPGLIVITVILLPAAYYIHEDRENKRIRREAKKNRRK